MAAFLASPLAGAAVAGLGRGRGMGESSWGVATVADADAWQACDPSRAHPCQHAASLSERQWAGADGSEAQSGRASSSPASSFSLHGTIARAARRRAGSSGHPARGHDGGGLGCSGTTAATSPPSPWLTLYAAAAPASHLHHACGLCEGGRGGERHPASHPAQTAPPHTAPRRGSAASYLSGGLLDAPANRRPASAASSMGGRASAGPAASASRAFMWRRRPQHRGSQPPQGSTPPPTTPSSRGSARRASLGRPREVAAAADGAVPAASDATGGGARGAAVAAAGSQTGVRLPGNHSRAAWRPHVTNAQRMRAPSGPVADYEPRRGACNAAADDGGPAAGHGCTALPQRQGGVVVGRWGMRVAAVPTAPMRVPRLGGVGPSAG